MIKKLEKKITPYTLQKITLNNIREVYLLLKENVYFSQFEEEQSLDRCIKDIKCVPPQVLIDQKFYYGIYEEDKMIALIDFITGYPYEKTIYLGLFVLKAHSHKKGLGTLIVQKFIQTMKEEGFIDIELGCYEDNEIGLNFWEKQGFKRVGSSKGMKLKIIKMKLEL